MIRDLGFDLCGRRRTPVVIGQVDGGGGVARGDDRAVGEVVAGDAGVVPLLIASWVLKTSTASWPLEPELRATLLRPKVSLVALSWPPELTAMVQVYPVAVKLSAVAVIVPLTAIVPP